MKKILITMHSMPIGGAERVLCDILSKLDYTVFDVTLLLYYMTGDLLTSLPNEVTVKSLYNKPQYTLFHRILERIYVIFKLRRKLDRKKVLKMADTHYDTIVSFCHGHGHMMHSFLFGRSKNNISWIHSDLSVGNWGLSFFDGDIKKQEAAYNQMTTIVYVSNDAKIAFHKVFNISKSVKEEVIYNFVNETQIKEKAILPNPSICKKCFTFINVGRLIPAKNQDRIIKASKIIKEQGYDFEFWIVGDGPLKEELEKEITKNDLRDTVILLGSQTNPYNYLNAADCFVLTSHQEGFSIVIVEAFVLGKPVITMRSSGPVELVGDSEYGILIEQSIDDLVRAMIEMMNNPEVYNNYHIKAKMRATDFNGEETMKQIEKLLLL